MKEFFKLVPTVIRQAMIVSTVALVLAGSTPAQKVVDKIVRGDKVVSIRIVGR